MEEQKKRGEDYIRELYDANLAGQKEALTQTYQDSLSQLEETQRKNQLATDNALNQTAVESQKAGMNWNEVQNAYGLSSGANAQAALVRENQLAANMTALRQQQNEADWQIERQRQLLGQKYQSAILQAQKENDADRANALYQEAKRMESQLLAQKENAAALMATAGDYSLYGSLYGLTPEQMAALTAQFNKSQGGYGGSGGGGYSSGYGSAAAGSGGYSGYGASYESEPDSDRYYVDGYGYLPYSDIVLLQKAGYIAPGKMENGKETYQRTAKKNYNNPQKMTR